MYDTLALEAVEVLGEAAAVGLEVVALNGEHEKSVDFIEGVKEAKQIAGVTVGSYGEEVAERGWDEGRELLFGEEF